MERKVIFAISVLFVFVIAAAGCASIQLPWSTTNTQQNPAGLSSQTVEDKLAIGTLKLEGTNNAVTAEQAQKMLPLWKAVKGLSSDSKMTTQEMNGLYQQIMAAMTPEQVKAIQDMTLEQGDLQELTQKYGIQMRGGAPGQIPEAARTQAAERINSGGQIPEAVRTQAANRRNDGGGFPGGGFQGGPGGGFQNGQQNRAQTTPQAGSARQSFRGGLNLVLSDAVIKLLEQRAGS